MIDYRAYALILLGCAAVMVIILKLAERAGRK